MCPTGRLSSDGTLARPGEAVCVRLLSSLLIKDIKASVPAPPSDARFRNRPAGHRQNINYLSKFFGRS